MHRKWPDALWAAFEIAAGDLLITRKMLGTANNTVNLPSVSMDFPMI
jgi:hypothetical protein